MKKLTVVKKTYDSTPKPVFDIEVAGDNHYLVGDGVVSHNSGFIFAASVIVSMNKRKLKEDADGNKITEVAGIRSKIKCVKTRYSKPFEQVEVSIPYDRGMDPYSGLFDMFEGKVLIKDGNRYRYVSKTDGTEHKLFRKQMTPEFYDMIMREWVDEKAPIAATETEQDDQEAENVE